MKSQEDRVVAESLFVREGKSLEQIAVMTGVSAGTLKRWSADGRWAAKRKEHQHESPSVGLEKLKRLRARLIEEMPEDSHENASQIDQLAKLDKSIAGMERRADTIGATLDVMMSFAQFVATNADVDSCTIIRGWTEKFLKEERRKNA